MTNKYIINWIFPLIVCGAFIVCAAVGMLIEPEAFYKFFSPTRLFREIPPIAPHKSYYWDVEAYAEMVINPSCKAFYPLWPLIIRNIFHPQSIEQAAHYLSVVATGLFFISNFLLFWVIKVILQRSYLTLLVMLAYTVNPMAIFRVLGYTESLFATLSTIFIWVLLPQLKFNNKIKLSLIFATTFLMALTRPILIQIFFATAATLITILSLEIWQLRRNFYRDLLTALNKYQYELKITIAIWIATLLGYSTYGIFCLQTRGSFFAPFYDQSRWGKTLGLHLELLLFPKSMLVDLLGLYLPGIILFLSLTMIYFKLIQQETNIYIPKYQFWWNILFLYPPLLICIYIFNFVRLKKVNFPRNNLTISNYTIKLAKSYIFWFCIYFTVIHSVIIFLTQDRLHSLGRYIFAVPFFFISVGYLYRCIPGKAKYQSAISFIAISAILLVLQWINYGQDKWLG